MAVPKSHVFAKGRPTNPHEAVTSILRYVPRQRTPWNPSSFQRENIMPDDLTAFWNMGRGRTGPAFPNSGYFTGKTSTLEENTIPLIPKAELEKYMPDIYLGPKALVTPVSMMNVRAGHRVTHDMLHSYDPYIGQNEKLATIDHDKITPQDPNRVGLHPATIHCRGRIYRWLRRGPFFQEDHYFRRNVAPMGETEATVTPEDVRLAKKVIRMATKGHLKGAAAEYRKFVSVPPVQVYRALTAACIGQGKIGDAVAIFEDGNSKLFYVARDPEVLMNLMKTAIAARNRSRVLWVYNVARGRFYENQLVRAEIDSITLYELGRLALEYFADNKCVEEARTVYDFMAGEETVRQQHYTSESSGGRHFVTAEQSSMTDYDLYKAVGLRLREALAKGESIPSYTASLGANLAVSKNAERVAAIVQKVLEASDKERNSSAATTGNSSNIPVAKVGEAPLQYLSRRFTDVDVAFVLRHARVAHNGKTDLLAPTAPAPAAAAGADATVPAPAPAVVSEEQIRTYANRAISWLTTLSRNNAQQADDVVMPYLRKSKPSAVNPNVRVAYLPETLQRTRLLANESGYGFHYSSNSRFVAESYAQPSASVASQLLALQPNHTPIAGTVSFGSGNNASANAQIGTSKRPSASKLLGYDPAALAARRTVRNLHPSIALSRAAVGSSAAAGGGNAATFTAVSSTRTGGVDAAAAAAKMREVVADSDLLS